VDKREDRRWRTQRAAERQLASYTWMVKDPEPFQYLPPWVVLHVASPLVPGRFRKHHAWGCNCRRRAAGRPRVHDGCCFAGERREAVRLRDAWLIERRGWLTDPLGDW
jgi:hypothetical protein